MEIIVGKTAGFCNGVKNTIKNVENELLKNGKGLYCLGEIIHNTDVVEDLKNKELIFVENIEEAKNKAVIRAHGVSKEIYNKAEKNNIELIDLTCSNIIKIHNIADEYSKKDYYIFLVAGKDHPETIGTISFCGKNSTIISNLENVEEAVQKLKESNFKKLLVISQTTYNLKLFEDIVKEIKERIPSDMQIEVKNTICNATELRQKETEEISKKVDLMIIIGGRKSSNTNKLYDISCKNCKNVIFIENKNEIDLDKILKFKKIGIMAGASTPNKSIEEIIILIKNNSE